MNWNCSFVGLDFRCGGAVSMSYWLRKRVCVRSKGWSICVQACFCLLLVSERYRCHRSTFTSEVAASSWTGAGLMLRPNRLNQMHSIFPPSNSKASIASFLLLSNHTGPHQHTRSSLQPVPSRPAAGVDCTMRFIEKFQVSMLIFIIVPAASPVLRNADGWWVTGETEERGIIPPCEYNHTIWPTISVQAGG